MKIDCLTWSPLVCFFEDGQRYQCTKIQRRTQTLVGNFDSPGADGRISAPAWQNKKVRMHAVRIEQNEDDD